MLCYLVRSSLSRLDCWNHTELFLLSFPRWKFLLLSVFIVVCQPQICVSLTVSGSIVDSTNQQPLPYVSVIFPDLRQGTFTDLHGRFTLHTLPSGNWEYQISCVGFHTVTDSIYLKADSVRTLSISLLPTVLPFKPEALYEKKTLQNLLKGVTRQAHEKVFHARYRELDTHQFNYHGTQTLYTGSTNETPIRGTIEFSGEGHYRKPGTIIQSITAYRAFGLAGRGFGMHPGVTVNIQKGQLNGVEFDTGPLPLQLAGQKTYRYQLVDIVQVGDVVVYHMNVSPRKRKDPGLEGDIWISSSDYSLVGYDLRHNESLLKKLRIAELRTYQENALYYNQFWLPTYQTIRIRTIAGNLAEQITQIDHYDLNHPVPDSLLIRGSFSMHPDAQHRPTTFWETREDSLHAAEQDEIQHLLESDSLPQGWVRLLR